MHPRRAVEFPTQRRDGTRNAIRRLLHIPRAQSRPGWSGGCGGRARTAWPGTQSKRGTLLFFSFFFFLFFFFFSFPSLPFFSWRRVIRLLFCSGVAGDGWWRWRRVERDGLRRDATSSVSGTAIGQPDASAWAWRCASWLPCCTLRHSAALCSTLRRLHTWLLLLQHSAGRGCCGAVLLRAHAP